MTSLAQAVPSPTASEFMTFLACVALIAFLANLILSIKSKWGGARSQTNITNEPLMVQESSRPVYERDCLTRHDQSTLQIKTLSAHLEELRRLRIADAKDASLSREKLYAAIKDVRLEVTTIHESSRKEMTKGFQDIERALGRLEGKINGIS